MRILELLILLFLITSCSDKKSGSTTPEFDHVLGKENTETLNLLVSDFENDFLKRQYPHLNIENAYRQFLIDLSSRKTDWENISEKARDKFASSDLRHEIYEFPDSVWILNNSSYDKIESDSVAFLENPNPYIKTRYKQTNPDGTTEYSFSRGGEIMPDSDYDSIIHRELEIPRINYSGKYLKALESIKDKSDFHKMYFELKKDGQFLPPYQTAQAMLDYELDLNNDLNRKIIVLEFAY